MDHPQKLGVGVNWTANQSASSFLGVLGVWLQALRLLRVLKSPVHGALPWRSTIQSSFEM